MAQPMMKAEPGLFVAERLARRHPNSIDPEPEIVARAEALERKLGRPLRVEIDGPLTDEESEEILLGRLTDGSALMPLDELLAKFGRA